MPQIHNRKLAMMSDSSALGKDSRFMTVLRVSDDGKRRIQACNVVENRLAKLKINVFNRHAEIHLRRREREHDVVLDNLKRTLAYKLVLEKHSFTHATDYHKALEDDYSAQALKHDVTDMMEYMKPGKVRERKAKALITENQKRYDSIVRRNKDSLDAMCPPSKLETSRTVDISQRQSSVREPPPPVKAVLPAKRQTITRSMLSEKAQMSMDVMDSYMSPRNCAYQPHHPPLHVSTSTHKHIPRLGLYDTPSPRDRLPSQSVHSSPFPRGKFQSANDTPSPRGRLTSQSVHCSPFPRGKFQSANDTPSPRGRLPSQSVNGSPFHRGKFQSAHDTPSPRGRLTSQSVNGSPFPRSKFQSAHDTPSPRGRLPSQSVNGSPFPQVKFQSAHGTPCPRKPTYDLPPVQLYKQM